MASTTLDADDLSPDACTEIELDSGLSNVTGTLINAVVTVDNTSEVSESNETNNTFSGEITVEQTGSETNGQSEEESETISYVCEELNIDPDSYVLATDEEDVEITVTVTLAEDIEEVSFWGKALAFVQDLLPDWDFLMAFTVVEVVEVVEVEGVEEKAELYWRGTLTVTTDGMGTFTDSNGESGSSLSVMLYETDEESVLSEAFTYTPSADDDPDRTLTAYIEDEDNCTDTLILAAEADEEEVAEEEEEIAEEESTEEEEVAEEESTTEEEEIAEEESTTEKKK